MTDLAQLTDALLHAARKAGAEAANTSHAPAKACAVSIAGSTPSLAATSRRARMAQASSTER